LSPSSPIVSHSKTSRRGRRCSQRSPSRFSMAGIPAHCGSTCRTSPDRRARTKLAPPSRVGKGVGGLGPAVGPAPMHQPPAPPPLRRERGGLSPSSPIVSHSKTSRRGRRCSQRSPSRFSLAGIPAHSGSTCRTSPDRRACTKLAPPSRVGKGVGGLGPAVRPPNMRPSRRTVRPTYEGARFWVCCRGEGPGGVWGVGRTGALPPGSRPRQGGQGCPWTGPRSGPPRCVTREPLR
jgi:hypothetical protein